MFKSLFRRPESSRKTIADNSEEPEQQIIEKLQNWNPPKITIDDVYEKETFKFRIFRSQFAIKEVQKTLSIRNEFEVFPLLERKKMLKHMKKFGYLHIRLIQVAVKPLTMKGLNTSVLVCLRDDRVIHFNASLLAVAESSLCDGPIYFNCYPTYSIALEDFRNLDVFTLNIRTHGLQREQGSGDIVIWYKVIYSVRTFPVWYGNLSVDDKTTFIQTNLLASNVEVWKTVQLDAMEVPERWRDQN